MKTYQIYKNLQGEVAVIKVGWSWPAFFFSWIWALTKKLWILALSSLIFILFIYYITNKSPILFVALLFGVYGNVMWKNHVLKNGYSLISTVQAEDVHNVIIE